MALLDLIAQMAGSTPGKMVGLPELQPGYEDYGPWGAGGGPVYAGMYPDAQDPSVLRQVAGAVLPHGGDGEPSGAGYAPEAGAVGPGLKPYNPMMDPNAGGLLGFLGRMSGNPTRQEYLASQAGQQSATHLRALQAAVQGGKDPQRAIMDYLNTPGGMEWFLNPGSNPMQDISDWMKLITPKAPSYSTVGRSLVDETTHQPVYTAPLDPTKEMQNYQNYLEDQKKKGLPAKSFEEYTAGPQPLQNVSQGTKVYDPNKGEQVFENPAAAKPVPDVIMKEAVDSSRNAQETLDTMQEMQAMKELVANQNTDALQPYTTDIMALAEAAFGIRIKDDLPAMQAIEAMANQMALRLRSPQGGFGGLTGNTSDKDIGFLLAAMAGIDKTPQANQIILTLGVAQFRRKAMLADAYSEYLMKNGSPAGWTAERKKLIDSTPLFTPQEEAEMHALRAAAGAKPITEGDLQDKVKFAGTGVKSEDTPPPGFTGDPELYKYLPPEDRKLWENAPNPQAAAIVPGGGKGPAGRPAGPAAGMPAATAQTPAVAPVPSQRPIVIDGGGPGAGQYEQPPMYPQVPAPPAAPASNWQGDTKAALKQLYDVMTAGTDPQTDADFQRAAAMPAGVQSDPEALKAILMSLLSPQAEGKVGVQAGGEGGLTRLQVGGGLGVGAGGGGSMPRPSPGIIPPGAGPDVIPATSDQFYTIEDVMNLIMQLVGAGRGGQ